MKIFVASDHAGFGLKEKLIPFLMDLGHEITDKGAFEYNEQDDYPDFMTSVAREVSHSGPDVRGILLGGTGQGEAILANRFHGVRAAVYYGQGQCVAATDDVSIIKLSREHNNANVLALGARFLTEEDMKNAVKEWLETPYNKEERHERRLYKIDRIKI